MTVFLILLLWVSPVIVGAIAGSHRGKLAAGILLPLFFSWFGTFVVLCLSDRTQSVTTNVYTSASVETHRDDDDTSVR